MFFPLVLEVNLLFLRKWKVHLKLLSKPRPVIFRIFGENVYASEVYSHGKWLGYSSVSKKPLSLEFYVFSRCHIGLLRPIHCHNCLSADRSSLTRALEFFKILKNGLKAELHPKAQWALDDWSVDISMSKDWNNSFTCSWRESIISEKMEGPLKTPV